MLTIWVPAPGRLWTRVLVLVLVLVLTESGALGAL
jgi:hypothetical protein